MKPFGMIVTFMKRTPDDMLKTPEYAVFCYGTFIGSMWMKHSAVTGKPDSTAAWGFEPKPDLSYKFDEIQLIKLLGEHLDREKGK